jgi:hypothetical protein
LNEKGRFNYTWTKYKVIIKDELDDDKTAVEKLEGPYKGKKIEYEKRVLIVRKWKNFNDRKK